MAKRYNNELCKLLGGEYIVGFIKAQRIQWLGHVERMDETAMPKRVLKGKLYTRGRIGRPRIRWLEDVIADLRRMGISGWMEKVRNRDQWRPRPTQGCSAKKKKNCIFSRILCCAAQRPLFL
jgi:hypothetical protein